MADNELGVKVTADVSGFQTPLDQASKAVSDAFGSVKGTLESIGGTIEGAHKELLALFAGFESIKKVIELTVEKTVEFNVEAIKMSRQLGITATEAAKLAIALDDAYIPTETYLGAATKLTRQLRSNEEALKAMGLQTRETNGEYKDSQTIMFDAIKLLNSYKEGTDRNLAAQALFGRGASELGNMLTFTKEKLEEAAKAQDKYNLYVGKESLEATAKYRAANNEMHDAIEGLKLTLGNALMPVLTELEEWLSDMGPAAIMVTKVAINSLVEAFRFLDLGVQEIWDIFKLFVKDMYVGFSGLANALDKLSRGDVKGAAAAMSKTWDDLKKSTAESFQEMTDDAVRQKEAMDALWAKPTKADKSDTDTGTGENRKYESKDSEEAAKEAAERALRLAEELAAHKEQLALGEIAFNRQKLEQQLKDGEITNEQFALQMQAELDKEYAAMEAFQAEKARLYEKDVVEKQKALDQIVILEQKHALESAKIHNKLVEDEKKRYEQMLAPIANAVEKSVTGMIQGTITAQKAINNILQSILAETVNMLVKKTVKWIASEAAQTAATQAGATTRLATEATAESTSASISSGSTILKVMNNAYSAMAAAFQSMCAIPVVGPALGVAAGAAAFAAVAGIVNNIRSAEGGYDIPSGLNPLVQTHQNEMILPAKYADVIRSLAERNSQGGGSSGGGDTHHYHINAIDAKSLKSFVTRNASSLSPALQKLARNGSGGKV